MARRAGRGGGGRGVAITPLVDLCARGGCHRAERGGVRLSVPTNRLIQESLHGVAQLDGERHLACPDLVGVEPQSPGV